MNKRNKKNVSALCIFGICFFCLCAKADAKTEQTSVRQFLPACIFPAYTETGIGPEPSLPQPPDYGKTRQAAPTYGKKKETPAGWLPPRQLEWVYPEKIYPEKPAVYLNGHEGALSYRWGYDCLSINDSAFLLSCDCYFPEERLQQKIFYLAQAPDYIPEEVFRQDSRTMDEDTAMKTPDTLEWRMICPQVTDMGYIFEADGILYCLNRDFREASVVCDLRKLMGELYEFSPWVASKNICDVTSDVSKLLACTDQGLYEYNLETGSKRLLEPAVFRPYEIVHAEGDCACGETGFEFSGPIEAKYAPDGQSYAFLTGTEYGDPDGVVLKSMDGKTLYQAETASNTSRFLWLETDNTVYFAYFFRDESKTWMDRVDTRTGEKMTFALPDIISPDYAFRAAFLDADSLIYYKKPEGKHSLRDLQEACNYEVYHFSDGTRQKLWPAKGTDWKITAIDPGGYNTIIVNCPLFLH